MEEYQTSIFMNFGVNSINLLLKTKFLRPFGMLSFHGLKRAKGRKSALFELKNNY